ncbi:M23 family metallopeptidase [Streptomyces fulvorobeus]|uniref:Peptidase n=1 Tax=Streptomyces fulvorobeus TaxID=284028 RepID=A0A7J0C8Q3_9ACTN|nr:M23 family metallopeptidase [Streptomyces fulvorobeus]NYE42500.1 murein DD-endopeptidase MepM/ murein hydrolase activator NlpD [Streptomyces fulvorobeus]GFM98900.1 peptidase [Streptomyces fulvorobeus]
MNDQHPHAGYVDYDNHPPGSFDTDPLFGALPGHHDGQHDPQHDGQHADGSPHGSGYGSGYETAQDAPYAYDSGYQAAGQSHSAGYDSAPWDTGTQQTAAYGQWDTSGWVQPGQAEQWATTDTGTFPAGTYGDTGYGTGTTGTYAADLFVMPTEAAPDTGAYDATAWNTGATPEESSYEPEQMSYASYEQQPVEQQFPYEWSAAPGTETHDRLGTHETDSAAGTHESEAGSGEIDEPELVTTASHPVGAPRAAGRSSRGSGTGSRGRRRTPAKRSAFLTVAVPSACVMSVAGIAAASVSGVAGGEEKKDATATMAAADPATVEPIAANNALDTQLAALSADADDFADRASRTQERIDLRERQAAEKKKREQEAARREALRPKFSLPVSQHGLSAYYGQAGVNWMSVHTGVDFPVGYGAPVMAATDGTVRTQFNSAYGNMAIVTAPDGTETWYCHLSSSRVRSGSVQAGDTIGYAGDSGNSTGPHLHFEVRPGGGAAIDPMPWFRSHGLNPN